MIFLNKFRRQSVFLLIAFLFGFFGFVEAKTIDQCFLATNLPDESIKSSWIENTTLKDEEIHKKLAKRLDGTIFSALRDNNLPVLLQDLSIGEGSTFAFRNRFPGWPGLSDTSKIQYLSIHVPGKLEKNREIDLSKANGVLTVITKGSPSFRNFCFGYAKKGKIKIMLSNGENDDFDNKMSKPIFDKIGKDSVLMDVDIMVDTKHSNKAWSEYCGSCVLQGKFVFSKSSLDQLNNE